VVSRFASGGSLKRTTRLKCKKILRGKRREVGEKGQSKAGKKSRLHKNIKGSGGRLPRTVEEVGHPWDRIREKTQSSQKLPDKERKKDTYKDVGERMVKEERGEKK